MIRRSRIPWVVLLCAILPSLVLLDCYSYREHPGTVEQVFSKASTRSIRVTVAGGLRFDLEGPWITTDTLNGWCPQVPPALPIGWTRYERDTTQAALGSVAHTDWSARSKWTRIAMPQSAVRRLEIREADAGKTVVLVVGLVALTVIVVAAITAPDMDGMGDDWAVEPSPNQPTSCPLLFSWDGSRWRLDSGTYAGAVMPALARSEVDDLDHLRPRSGVARLRLVGLTGETEHVDGLALLAVDHDPGLTIVPDLQGRLRTLGPLTPPSGARDFAGADGLERVAKADEWCWQSSVRERDPERAEDLHDGLELDFPRRPGAGTARLLVEGANTPWVDLLMADIMRMAGTGAEALFDSIGSDPGRAARLREAFARESFLRVSVWNGAAWEAQGFVGNVGPELTKRQVVDLDLSRSKGETVRVRLESTPDLWLVDRVAIDYTPERDVVVRELRTESARDLHGRDVRALLAAEDGREYVIAPGDTAEVTFRVPATPDGRARTYLARTTGWYRIHTPGPAGPRRELLSRLETEPGAVARYSIVRMNQALTVLAEAGRRAR